MFFIGTILYRMPCFCFLIFPEYPHDFYLAAVRKPDYFFRKGAAERRISISARCGEFRKSFRRKGRVIDIFPDSPAFFLL